MESWNAVINASLLGTEKRALKPEELDAVFAESLALITSQTADKEYLFLGMASVMYNVRQCGTVPLRNEAASIPQAEAEEKEYASPAAHAVLRDIVETGSVSLLRFWLEACANTDKIVQPEVVPLLLNVGAKTASLQLLVAACCGKRGLWLQQFNEDWQWYGEGNSEDLWDTGTLPQRKKVLTGLRQTDPAKGRELLQQTWPQEAAATKLELLQAMFINAGDDDVVWLEGLATEKSTKVKDAALDVLKTIPSSSVVQQYWGILKESIRLTTSKGLLGIGAKTTLEINPVPVDPAIFKTGIQAVSKEKGISDEAFVIHQLTAGVPPHFWEEQFGLEKEKLLALFSKEGKQSGFVSAFGKAAIRFKNLDWLRQVIAHDAAVFHSGALAVLPQKEAEAYALKFLGKDDKAPFILQHLDEFAEEWSSEFAKALLRYTAKNPYQYHRGFYNDIAALLPVPFVGELEKCTPKDEYHRNLWSTQIEHLTKLPTLKLQTLKAFNE